MYIYKSNRLVALDTTTGTKYMFGMSAKRCKFESVDMKITNKCDHNCPFCSECSCKVGEHADIELIKMFVHSYCLPYTEFAIGGGNPLEHPQLEEILQMLYENGNPLALTVHIDDLMDVAPYLQYLKAIGVSYTTDVEYCNNILDEFKQKYGDKVQINVHIIPDLYTVDQILSINHDRIVLLGFKDIGKGLQFWNENKEWMLQNRAHIRRNLHHIVRKFRLVVCDDLACVQYGLCHGHSIEGIHSAFFDAVEGKICNSSYDRDNRQNYHVTKKGIFVRPNTFETSSSTLSALIFDKNAELYNKTFVCCHTLESDVINKSNLDWLPKHILFNSQFSKFVLILANVSYFDNDYLRNYWLDTLLKLNKQYGYTIDDELIKDIRNGDFVAWDLVVDDMALPEYKVETDVKTYFVVKEFIENSRLVWEQGNDWETFIYYEYERANANDIVDGVWEFVDKYPDLVVNKSLLSIAKCSKL